MDISTHLPIFVEEQGYNLSYLLGKTPCSSCSRVNMLQVFLTTTSLIAIVTVIFCGGATQPLLKALHIPVGLNIFNF